MKKSIVSLVRSEKKKAEEIGDTEVRQMVRVDQRFGIIESGSSHLLDD